MIDSTAPEPAPRPAADLFLVSLLILFMELACIRWFGSMVVYLTFFTNIALLAAFLGISVGCLAAARRRHLVETVVPTLLLGMALACLVLYVYTHFSAIMIDVGGQGSPQQIFFGTEYRARDLTRFVVPLEAVAGLFFVLIALAFVGLGQVMGRAFNMLPDRMTAYTVNIAGSLAGIAGFALVSYLRAPPAVWFAILFVLILGCLPRWTRLQGVSQIAVMVLLALAANAAPADSNHLVALLQDRLLPGDAADRHQQHRAPGDGRHHERRSGLLAAAPAEPRCRRRLVRRRPDHRRRLRQRCRRRAAPRRPPRRRSRDRSGDQRPWPALSSESAVCRSAGDRSCRRRPEFLCAGPARPTTWSSMRWSTRWCCTPAISNIRLESFLFTREAFADIRRVLKPDGVFVAYNFYRQPWLVGRLQTMMAGAFGRPPLVMTLPYQAEVRLDQESVTVHPRAERNRPHTIADRTPFCRRRVVLAERSHLQQR